MRLFTIFTTILESRVGWRGRERMWRRFHPKRGPYKYACGETREAHQKYNGRLNARGKDCWKETEWMRTRTTQRVVVEKLLLFSETRLGVKKPSSSTQQTSSHYCYIRRSVTSGTVVSRKPCEAFLSVFYFQTILTRILLTRKGFTNGMIQ